MIASPSLPPSFPATPTVNTTLAPTVSLHAVSSSSYVLYNYTFTRPENVGNHNPPPPLFCNFSRWKPRPPLTGYYSSTSYTSYRILEYI